MQVEIFTQSDLRTSKGLKKFVEQVNNLVSWDKLGSSFRRISRAIDENTQVLDKDVDDLINFLEKENNVRVGYVKEL